MVDAGIRRRLNAIIVLQLLLIALALPGSGPAFVLLVALLVFYVIFFGVSILERRPGED
ncbi:hypothetical protein ACFQDG_05595 [Natronoarchaeum mannanilyticum]